MRKILKQKVHHDGTSMVVLKEGDRYDVPDRLVQTWIDEGIIAGKSSKQVAAERQARIEDEEAEQGQGSGDVNPYSAEHKGFGVYHLTGPGLAEPEEVKGGKDQAEARINELWTAHKAATAGDDGAPTV